MSSSTPRPVRVPCTAYRLSRDRHAAQSSSFPVSCFTRLTCRNQYAPAIDEYFADDAVYQSPAHATKGKRNIEHVFALHQAFRSDSKIGEVKWDDQ